MGMQTPKDLADWFKKNLHKCTWKSDLANVELGSDLVEQYFLLLKRSMVIIVFYFVLIFAGYHNFTIMKP